MSSNNEFIKKNASLILHSLITFIICVVLRLLFEKFPDYLMLGNISLFLLGVYFLYRCFIKKNYIDSFLKLMCTISTIIIVNRFYLYKILKTVFPWLINVNQNWLMVVLIALLVLIFKLVAYIEPINASKNENNDNNFRAFHNEVLSFLWFLVSVIILCALILIPAFLLYFFNKYDLNKSALDFDKVFSFLLSYGSSFIFILFAFIITIIALIYIIKFIANQIKNFKLSNTKNNDANEIPTYAFSVIIVLMLLFLSWRITDFSLDDLTQVLVAGEYLALPLTVIVIIILFFLLVWIVNTVILMLSKEETESIKKYLSKWKKNLNIGSRILEIIKVIIDIVLDTILSVFGFVKLVPSFVDSIGKILFSENYNESSASQISEKASQISEEASRIGTEETSRISEEANQISEEANQISEEASQISEEASRIGTGETSRISEETSRMSKEARQISEEARQISEEASRFSDEVN